MSRPSRCITPLLGVSMALFAGCTDFGPFGDEAAELTFFQEFADVGDRVVEIIGVSGSIDVRAAANRTSVRIEGERRVEADTRSDAERSVELLDVEFTTDAAVIQARTVEPPPRDRESYEVHYRVTVPLGTRVRLTQLNGNTETFGELTDLDIDIVNGNIDVDRATGAVTLDTDNGNIDVGLVVGTLAASTTNGGVFARVEMPLGARTEIHSVNGNLHLEMPGETSAMLELATTNGSVTTSGFTLTDATIAANRVMARIGNGDGDVVATTTNGNVRFEARP